MLALLIVVLLVGTAFYATVEHWGVVDSFYFSVMTVTTVGYGDLSPGSAASKVFTALYVLIGFGVLLGFVDVVMRNAVRGAQLLGLRKGH